jgi:[protein-PII] uridylyltransferase
MLDNDASEEATVVEASGRDRPGLLEGLARAVADAGLSITSAHIDGYGERAVDAFYVQTPGGGKLTDAKRATALKSALMDVLEAEDSGQAARGRPRLERARASIGR